MNNELNEWLNGDMKDLVVFDKETNKIFYILIVLSMLSDIYNQNDNEQASHANICI